MKTQGREIEAQLDDGIRYLDLRIYQDHEEQNIFVSNRYRSCTLKEMLERVKAFLDRTELEIVFLDFSRLYSFDAITYMETADLIVETLGNHLAPPGPAGATAKVQELWDRGQRAVVFYPETYQPSSTCELCGSLCPSGFSVSGEAQLTREQEAKLWSRSHVYAPEPTAHNFDDMKAELERQIESRPAGQFFVLPGFVNPDCYMVACGQGARTIRFFNDGEDLLARCLPGFLRMAIPRFWRDLCPEVMAASNRTPVSLKELAEEVTLRVVAWVSDDWEADRLNIISVDWYEVVDTQLLDVVKQLTMKPVAVA
ncbi:MAG: hypothetical protein ETSY2_46155 [Candidatus Entotheonella gemina]|uniref:1-phosphatidylinositol phosphodiesterase n=1 Tax=Candidatus Entotheonella gemina TaxID=1429439 RepID=W4LGU7_9BACT|nr:MAG: hypothetical protein ETSY2_46155 [Candidatus Entotheonella gemina]